MAEEEIKSGKSRSSQIRLIIIIALGVIIVGAGGFFLGKILSGGDPQNPDIISNAEKEKTQTDNANVEKDNATNSGNSEAQKIADETAGLLVLEKFTVNLNDPFGRRYAEIQISLKIEKKSLVATIQSNELLLPQIRDEIFMIISSKSYPELNSVAGKVTLKEEIMIRLNELMKESIAVEPVHDVFFGTFIIQ